jgi:hypothetical protein
MQPEIYLPVSLECNRRPLLNSVKTMRPLDALIGRPLALRQELEPSVVWEHYHFPSRRRHVAAPEVQGRDRVRSLIG